MPTTMTFDNSRPIYAQIVERLTYKIIAGEYAAGQRLASVRELAAEFGVNPNTMQRAMAELERQALLYTERTAGRFITQDEAVICAVRDAAAQQIVADFTKTMAQMGYDNAQLIALLQQAALSMPKQQVTSPTQPATPLTNTMQQNVAADKRQVNATQNLSSTESEEPNE